MLTYVFGLISPDALTIAARSCFCALPVWTTTIPLLLWWITTATTIRRIRAVPSPMSTFFQVFMRPLSLPAARLGIPTCEPGQDVDAETVSSPGCLGDGGRTSSDTIQRSGKFRLVSWQKWLHLRRNLKMVAPLGKR